MIKYENNKILLNDKELVFEHNIFEAAFIFGKLIIVFETDEDNGYDNVYCFNRNQDKLWRIKQVPKEIGGTVRTPYVGVDIYYEKCRVVDFFGRRFTVDINDGHIISKDIVR